MCKGVVLSGSEFHGKVLFGDPASDVGILLYRDSTRVTSLRFAPTQVHVMCEHCKNLMRVFSYQDSTSCELSENIDSQVVTEELLRAMLPNADCRDIPLIAPVAESPHQSWLGKLEPSEN